jgi:hypothetical protein
MSVAGAVASDSEQLWMCGHSHAFLEAHPQNRRIFAVSFRKCWCMYIGLLRGGAESSALQGLAPG